MKVVVLNWKDYLGMGGEYVSKVREMASRHLTVPHEFIVVTESELPEGRQGWFNKLFLLDMFDDEVLYLDLDIMLTENIDHLVEIARSDKSKIWARNDFSYPVPIDYSPLPPITDGWREQTINSSLMIWNGKKDMSGLTNEMLETFHGDQGIITQLFWPDGIGLLPDDSIHSYKYHCLRNLGSAPVVVFHGSPKPHEVGMWP